MVVSWGRGRGKRKVTVQWFRILVMQDEQVLEIAVQQCV